MKKMILCIYLMLAVTTCFAQDEEVIKKKKVCFSIEQLKEDEFWNMMVYPRPVLSNTDLQAHLKKKLFYPPLAVKGARSARFCVPLLISTEGKATFLQGVRPINYEFESIAIDLLADSNFLWIPAKRNKKSYESVINVPVAFYLQYENGMLFYNIEFFINFGSIRYDSTNSFPALIQLDGEEWCTNSEREFLTPSELENAKPYGAVSIAFEIDTLGNIFDQKVSTSISAVLDNLSLEFVKSTNGKWISARKNGVKVPSYKYFWCLYDDVYIMGEKPVAISYHWSMDLSLFKVAYQLRRNHYAEELNRAKYTMELPLSLFDNLYARRLLEDKKYAESLGHFNRAANYYYHDATLFLNRSIANHYLGNKEKSCDDLQHVLDIAESEGFPHGITKEQVENLIVTFCQ